MRSTRKRWGLLLVGLILLAFIVYFVTGIIRSLYLESTYIQVTVPTGTGTGASGTVRVAQVSDLHRAVYGENNQELVDLIADKNTDIIVATGDMIDASTKEIDDTIDLFRRLVQIAPVVYSLGNHEMARDDVRSLLSALSEIGVHVVNNNAVTIEVNGMSLTIGGLYRAEYLRELDDDGSIDILLCHFPHKLSVFAEYGVPLTFCGHTHGGQFRIPLLDIALYAPGQGLFPQYTAGLYQQGDSMMIVSRGLGNSSFPFRVHNPPEVIIADVTFVSAR